MKNIKLNTGQLFILKFLLFFTVLYLFNLAAIGITDPKNYYNSFIAKHLNYLDWIRSGILYTANIMTKLAGLDTFVKENYYLKVHHGPGVRMAHECLGYGVNSFWVAFVLANHGGARQKALWIFFGFFCIYLLNCVRISLLVIAAAKRWPLFQNIDHHTLFNIFSYAIIFVLVYFYIRKIEAPTVETETLNAEKPLAVN